MCEDNGVGLKVLYHPAIQKWVKVRGLEITVAPECEGGGYMVRRDQGEKIVDNEKCVEVLRRKVKELREESTRISGYYQRQMLEQAQELDAAYEKIGLLEDTYNSLLSGYCELSESRGGCRFINALRRAGEEISLAVEDQPENCRVGLLKISLRKIKAILPDFK